MKTLIEWLRRWWKGKPVLDDPGDTLISAAVVEPAKQVMKAGFPEGAVHRPWPRPSANRQRIDASTIHTEEYVSGADSLLIDYALGSMNFQESQHSSFTAGGVDSGGAGASSSYESNSGDAGVSGSSDSSSSDSGSSSDMN